MKRKSKSEQSRGGGSEELVHMIKVGMVIVAVLSTIAGTVWGASEYVQTLAKRADVDVIEAR